MEADSYFYSMIKFLDSENLYFLKNQYQNTILFLKERFLFLFLFA